MEYLDLVNEKDEVVGVDTRENIYKQGYDDQIRVINILIFNSRNQLLVPKRAVNRKICPDCYDCSVGEHVKSGEDYYSAAIRGLEEELGISNISLEFLTKFNPHDNKSHCYSHLYRLIYERDIPNFDKEGISELNWWDLGTVKRKIKDSPESFKSDFLIIMDWYFDNFK